jgi:peptidoglycan/xylan/chitin deacetylase (PgdA/CDA1 family)
MNNFDINNNNCILTFDDDLKCHLNIVFPILKKYNLIGSFYISGLPIF